MSAYATLLAADRRTERGLLLKEIVSLAFTAAVVALAVLVHR
jgi:hypothetical protein